MAGGSHREVVRIRINNISNFKFQNPTVLSMVSTKPLRCGFSIVSLQGRRGRYPYPKYGRSPAGELVVLEPNGNQMWLGRQIGLPIQLMANWPRCAIEIANPTPVGFRQVDRFIFVICCSVVEQIGERKPTESRSLDA